MYYYCISVDNDKSFLRHPSYFRRNWDSVPLEELISFWRGHKEILKANFIKRWYYKPSTARADLLKEAEKWITPSSAEEDFDTIFVDYPDKVIPAMLEMGIFFKFLNAILNTADEFPHYKRKFLSDTLNSPEIKNIFGIQKGFTLSSDAERFVALRNSFSFRTTNDFCEDRLKASREDLESCKWFDFTRQKKMFLNDFYKYSIGSVPEVVPEDLAQALKTLEEKKVTDFLSDENIQNPNYLVQVKDFVEEYLDLETLPRFLLKLKDDTKSEKLFNIKLCFSLFESTTKAKKTELYTLVEYLLSKIEEGKYDDSFEEYDKAFAGEVFQIAIAKRILQKIKEDKERANFEG